MSLSKYFKHSDSFQPEGIFKIGPEKTSGWKASVKDDRVDQFQTEKQLEKNTLKLSQLPKEEASGEALKGEEQKSDSDQTHDKTGETESSSEAPDPAKYVEISEMKKKLKEAYEAGLQSGVEKAEDDYGSATKSLLATCQQLDTVREVIITNSSREIQDFALTIAERIVRRSVRNDNSTIIATIDEALQRAVRSEEFYIYLNPGDYDIVVEKSHDLIAGLSGLSNIVIKKDATVEKGGTKIESDNCTIDATIASQFDVIQEELKMKE